MVLLPVSACQLRKISSDNVSAAEMERRKLEKSRCSAPGERQSAVKSVGKPKKTLGRYVSIISMMRVGSGRPGINKLDGPDGKRKRHGVAKAIGEEHFRDREAQVAAIQVENVRRIGLRGIGHIVVEVDDTFRASRRTG